MFSGLAVKWAARRLPETDTIPRSGERARGVNCYVVYADGPHFTGRFLLDGTSREGLEGRLLRGAESEPVTIPWMQVSQLSLEFTHFVGPHEFTYSSPIGFLLSEIFFWPRYRIIRNDLEQFFFNRRRLALAERMVVLERLVERTLENRGYATSAPGFFAEFHSYRGFQHPDRERHIQYIELVLGSLAESGDLEQQAGGGAYLVTPRALTTISRYELEERQHRDRLRQQRGLAWLTAALVLVGIGQIVALVITST